MSSDDGLWLPVDPNSFSMSPWRPASPRSGGRGCTGPSAGCAPSRAAGRSFPRPTATPPARTEPWQAMVASTWSSRSPSSSAAPFWARSSAMSRTSAWTSPLPSTAGTARTSMRAGRSARVAGQSPASVSAALPAGRRRARPVRPLRGSAAPGCARRYPRAGRRSRSSTSRSCAACWSTITSPSSASATI
jgi:hypothetical protein